jgi:hypothetical protein
MGDKKTWSDPELILDQWQRYEAITMHFNDLLMRFRTQALGGLATVATLAGLLSKDAKSASAELPVFFFVLLIFWIAAWQLDQRYYSKLLGGAVAELEEFEKATIENDRHRIGLSTTIERVVGGPSQSKAVVSWFYGLITFGLVILIGATTARALTAERAEASATVALPVTCTVDALLKIAGGGATPRGAPSPALAPR